MAVFLARSECRKGYWHVITYDISDPDRWIEIDDQKTRQRCSEVPHITTLRKDLYAKLLQATTVALSTPNGDRITFTMQANGVNVLSHETAKGEIIQQTCSGKCGKPPNQTTVGPIPCPSGSGFLDCTKNPPTLICFAPKKRGQLSRNRSAKKRERKG